MMCGAWWLMSGSLTLQVSVGCRPPGEVWTRIPRQTAPCQPVDLREGGPDRFAKILEARVDRNEAKAAVEANGYADERAVDIDDV